MMRLLAPLAASGLLLAVASIAEGPDWPDDSDLKYVDLGTHDVHDTGGYTGELKLDIPPEAASVVVHCGEYGATALAAPWKVTSPDGVVMYDGDKPEESTMRAEFVDDRSAMILPPTPAFAFEAGTWTIDYWVGKGNTGKATCGAVFRTGTPSERPKVGMEFVLVGLPELNAANAMENKGFQQFVESLQKEFDGANIDLVTSVKDFEGDVEKYTVLDMSDDDLTELNDLLRLNKPASNKVISVFLVQEIANHSAGGATVLGISAGPPGTPGLPGTSKSGLAVSAMDLTFAPNDVAGVLSHELGHYLGLFHTTEKDGHRFDPLEDTPECPYDGNENGIMNTHECEKAGSDNVMWWTLRQDGKRRPMSEQQAWLLKRSPAAE